MPREPRMEAMTCDEIQERLEAFVDGELEAGTAAAIEAHLAGCEACAAEHSLTEAVRRELRALPELDAPPAVLGRVLSEAGRDRFRPAETRPTRSGRPAWAAWAAAAFTAVVLGAAMLLGPSRQPSPPDVGPAPDASLADAMSADAMSPDAVAADPEAVARATEEARFALAYVARISRRTGLKLRDDLHDHVTIPTVRSLSRSLLVQPEPPAGEAGSLASSDSDRS